MQKANNYYVGIDVSKEWFDVALQAVSEQQRQLLQRGRFDNTVSGIRAMDKWLKRQCPLQQGSMLVVIENTGIYHRLIWEYCSKTELPLYIGNATDLKWSMGIVRDKNDQADSVRLCEYAMRHADDLQASAPLDAELLVLKDLLTARSRLLRQINSNRMHLDELKNFSSAAVQKMMEQAHKAALKGLRQSLEQIEEQIKERVQHNDAIRNNYDLLRSVPGIGHVVAVYLICCTANFNGKRNGKQLACYAGVVPFEQRSGKSIKGKARVHKMANKELKRILHLSALTAKRCYPEFSDYYQRKTAQGKHPMAVLNAIRNKIVLRAAAVIKNQSAYVDNYKKAA